VHTVGLDGHVILTTGGWLSGWISSMRIVSAPLRVPYAIVSSITRREAEMVAEIAREVGLMEQWVMAEAEEDPQEFLSQLFAARHELLTIKTMAEQGSEIYRRAIKLARFAPPEGWS
jgi:magnesium transporter